MFLTLKNRISEATTFYGDLLDSSGLDYIFNPSFAQLGSQLVMVFRGSSKKNSNIRAYLLVHDFLGRPTPILDLSQHFSAWGVVQTADPKLFQFGDTIWVTFNTGWSRFGNDIYIAPLYPNLGRPLRCDFSGRQKIEKNWAFYSWRGALRAIYALGNGTVLESQTDPTQSQGRLEMVPVGSVSSTRRARGLSIGTQLAFSADAAYLVAHRKFHILGKRAYIGKLVRLDFSGNDVYATSGGKYVFHSFGSLLGSRMKRNRNLISCSYFSGLQLQSGVARLGYGINDVAFGFADADLSEFQ
ncbi:hypothetical protein V6617_01390 [Pelagibacterium nitratireducens]|uniref:Uncharacterized protein n=1 Tax=Pelagibacterium nitratireducens TaxID=1046114 RepID=A0ABZ2I5F0_9HYPH